ncbi:unnamed protein product [Leptosia nina]|uniref:Origin recognition complex subunit 6 n=1 Tax=Leptosia nina TaxID=320188 RepID=A0AAV1J2A2_9NEOP
MATSKTLLLLANKLGIAEEGKLLSKAAELERLLQMKLTAGNNLTDTSRIVICLDLAATIYGADLDHKTAIKYSGLKGPTYTSSKKMVENLLELNNDKLTVSSLCLNFQCNGVKGLAENILQDIQKTTKMELDMTLPQYACMAVYQACRINKIKLPKSKMVEKSRLKLGQWSKLEAEWAKIIDEKFAVVMKRGRPAKVKVVDDEKAMDIDTSPKKEIVIERKVESYEDWKRRMLEQAYKELEVLENERKIKKSVTRLSIHEESLRRSPRKTPIKSPQKTPQKFSPYKGPRKDGVIRLVFPKDF